MSVKEGMTRKEGAPWRLNDNNNKSGGTHTRTVVGGRRLAAGVCVQDRIRTSDIRLRCAARYQLPSVPARRPEVSRVSHQPLPAHSIGPGRLGVCNMRPLLAPPPSLPRHSLRLP